MSDWDVIIVGAGPAGSALACRLARTHRVLLLERSADLDTHPRIGESLPGAASRLLQRMGLLDAFLSDAHIERGASVSVWDDSEPVWRDSLRDPDGPGWHLDRRAFDARLRAAAVAAGAELITDCGPVRVARTGLGWSLSLDRLAQSHRAPVLIDASGRSASVLRQLGSRRREHDALFCLHVFFHAEASDDDHCTCLQADADGWWYSVRLPGAARVLAFHCDRDCEDWQRLRDPAHFLSRARAHALLAERLPRVLEGRVQIRPAGGAVFDLPNEMADTRGILAIGDAGLCFDPIASQGLFHALASAESAAQAIADGFPHQPDAGRAFLAEMQSVERAYLRHRLAAYRGPQRFAHLPFWASRTQLPDMIS